MQLQILMYEARSTTPQLGNDLPHCGDQYECGKFLWGILHQTSHHIQISNLSTVAWSKRVDGDCTTLVFGRFLKGVEGSGLLIGSMAFGGIR